MYPREEALALELGPFGPVLGTGHRCEQLCTGALGVVSSRFPDQEAGGGHAALISCRRPGSSAAPLSVTAGSVSLPETSLDLQHV